MSVSIDEIKEIQNDYTREYLQAPYNKYISVVGISKVKPGMDSADGEIGLKEGESLDDLCLSVGFKTVPPKDMALPDVYKGARVFYKMMGEIRAYKSS